MEKRNVHNSFLLLLQEAGYSSEFVYKNNRFPRQNEGIFSKKSYLCSMYNELYATLRREMETLAGFSMQTRRDFDRLAELVFHRTGETISTTTLRRFWGYQEARDDRAVAPHTLNQLSRMLGHADWNGFCEHASAGSPQSEERQSGFVSENNFLDSESLNFGDRIAVTWLPDRRIVIEYQGAEVFRVISAEHTQLLKDDVFSCAHFVQGQPLLCRSLIRIGFATSNYVCGRHSGIKFLVMHKVK